MFFIRKKPQANSPANLDEKPDIQPNAPVADAQPSPTGRMFHRPRTYSGPETHFENEAWAPESGYVGLFGRRRARVEEQTSPPTGSQ